MPLSEPGAAVTSADPGAVVTADPHRAARVRRDVVATFATFAANGAIMGSWTSRVPALKEHLDVRLSVLGLVFLCMGFGSLLSMPFTGFLLKRMPTRPVAVVGSIGTVATLIAVTHVHHVVVFAALYALAGLCYGAWDVTLNVHANAVELASKRTIMPALHGAWGAGMLVGAASGYLFSAGQVSLERHILVVMPILFVIANLAMAQWLDLRDQHVDAPGSSPMRRRRMIAISVVMGLMVMCSTIGEGSASDWLALHMIEDHATTAAVGVSVYVVYALFLTTGRLLGHLLINGLGRVNAIRVSGIVTCVGVIIVIFSPGLAVSYVGTALWGVGLAVVFPASVSAAGELGGAYAGQTIATVAAIAYGGFLVGPPVLGFLGDHFGLGNAFWVVAVLAIAYSLLAPITRPRRTDIAAGAAPVLEPPVSR